MRKISILSSIIGIIPFLGLQSQEVVCSLDGRVIENHTAAGIPEANLVLFKNDPERNGSRPDYYAVTNLNGTYTVHDILPGSYIIKISCIGYEQQEQVVSLLAGVAQTINFQLDDKPFPLPEVTVSTLRKDQLFRQVCLPMGIITSREISTLPGLTGPEVLASEPGVSLIRDGIWATSVSIRGLSEQRIITLVDGNRMETATDIAGGLAMIDLNDVERIEVIKGSGSTLYGSGALGGVLNILTRDGYYSNTSYFSGLSTTGYQSVNDLWQQSLLVRTGSSNWYAKISGMIRNAGNVITPAGELNNSQFSDNNLAGSLGFKLTHKREVKINLQRYVATNVGIPGGKAFPANATATYPIEKRQLANITYSFEDITPSFKKFSVKYYIQYLLRDVELRPSATVLITPTGVHLTNGIQVQGEFKVGEKHSLIGGLDAWQRILVTEREKRISTPITDTVGNTTGFNTTVRGEMPIPNADFTDVGIFIQDEYQLIRNKLNLTLGGRVDEIRVNNEEARDPMYISVNGVVNENPAGQRITFAAAHTRDMSWSASMGLMYTPLDALHITLTAARSFRSPSLEERFKYIDLGSLVQLGDPSLKPEHGWFIDLGMQSNTGQHSISINGFVNRLENLIVGKPGTFFYSYSGDPSTTDTLPALINSNVDEAILFGFDGHANFHFLEHCTLSSGFAFVRGRDTKNSVNLPSIPALNGEVGLAYEFDHLLEAKISVHLSDKQYQKASSEYATGGFALYNLGIQSASVKLHCLRIRFYAGIENLFNRDYRLFLSTNRGVVKSEPGRNFLIRINVRW